MLSKTINRIKTRKNMKEFRSKSSGRFIFNEDMHNLQDLALSMTALFEDCELNFVITGCEITVTDEGTSFVVDVSEGYVWLDGKVRKVDASTKRVFSVNSVGIYVNDVDGPDIAYVSGSTGKQYLDYTAFSSANYRNTDDVPCILAYLSDGVRKFPNLRDTFFAHYCLLNSGANNYISLLNAGEIDAPVIKLNHNSIDDLFVKKAGDTMDEGAILTLVSGEFQTIISGSGIDLDGSLNAGDITINGHGTIHGNLEARAFIKDDGSGDEFLKADGTVDDTAYLPLTGGTISGSLTINTTTEQGSGSLTVGNSLNVLSSLAVGNLLTAQQGAVTVSGTLTASTDIEGGRIIKTGGTSTEMLLADGTTKSINDFCQASALAGYLPITGGTLTGPLKCNENVTLDKKLFCVGEATFDDTVTSDRFITKDGTASQFVKGNGTLDSNTYVTTNDSRGVQLETALAGYLPLTGGTLTGQLTCNNNIVCTGGAGEISAKKYVVNNGTASQFLKADGSLDGNTYLTTGSAASTYLTIANASGLYLPLIGGTITGALIVNSPNGITANKFIVDSNLSGFLMANGTVSSVVSNSHITDNSISGSKIIDASIGGGKIAGGAIIGSHIDDAAIVGRHINGLAIVGSHIQNNSIESGHIAANSIENRHITQGAVGSGEIAVDSIDGQHISQQVIDYTHISFDMGASCDIIYNGNRYVFRKGILTNYEQLPQS